MKDVWTIREALAWGTEQLTSPGNPSPRLDAETLLSLAISSDRASLFAHPQKLVEAPALEQYVSWIEMRKNHYPLQYIRGSQEFYGRDFIVTPDTLIPRPETELLVETCLELCQDLPPHYGSIQILDLGTGSGCIAISLAAEIPSSKILATDIDPHATQVARVNAERLLAEKNNMVFFISDLGNCLSSGFKADFIVSNPPYVGWSEIEKVDPSVILHEPDRAVFSGDTGLDCFRRIFSESGQMISSGGSLLLEIGEGQAERLEKLGKEAGWQLTGSHSDLAGITRCLVFSPARGTS